MLLACSSIELLGEHRVGVSSDYRDGRGCLLRGHMDRTPAGGDQDVHRQAGELCSQRRVSGRQEEGDLLCGPVSPRGSAPWAEQDRDRRGAQSAGRDLPCPAYWPTVYELGADYFDRLDATRIQRHHIRRLEQLGYTVPLTPLAA